MTIKEEFAVRSKKFIHQVFDLEKLLLEKYGFREREGTMQRWLRDGRNSGEALIPSLTSISLNPDGQIESQVIKNLCTELTWA